AAAALHEAGVALGGADSPARHRQRQSALLDGIIETGVQAGVFRPAVGDAQAILISRLLYCAHELIHRQHLSQDDTVSAITHLIFDGIRPRDPAPSVGAQRAANA